MAVATGLLHSLGDQFQVLKLTELGVSFRSLVSGALAGEPRVHFVLGNEHKGEQAVAVLGTLSNNLKLVLFNGGDFGAQKGPGIRCLMGRCRW